MVGTAAALKSVDQPALPAAPAPLLPALASSPPPPPPSAPAKEAEPALDATLGSDLLAGGKGENGGGKGGGKGKDAEGAPPTPLDSASAGTPGLASPATIEPLPPSAASGPVRRRLSSSHAARTSAVLLSCLRGADRCGGQLAGWGGSSSSSGGATTGVGSCATAGSRGCIFSGATTRARGRGCC